ncbi:vanadium-dependent haloperoxidase [Algoriphagus sediminis]|uniref:Vanadium-dependent haloperoxidase n=1 Tax=Algoriphagus sediminis TaxID=3057113 RepID=A0ABT7Y7W6_9BACT|nr:vanadium-dependent haloperoxidase [Algoriphagus sediminis]MDN3202612.1 vanadium-dependent haloperoxidase [Algoriphagus sediminis]
MIKRTGILVGVLLICFNTFGSPVSKVSSWPEIYADELFHITEVMVTDVASPPVAARIYAYTNLASFLVIEGSTESFRYPEFLPFTYLEDQNFDNSNLSSPEFAAIYAMLLVGEKIMPSGYLLKEKMQEWESFGLKEKLLKKKELDIHISTAKKVADWVISVASKDGYLQLSTLTRYSPTKEKGRWYPTPPAYIAAIEPEWKTIKPFFLQDLDPFDPEEMAPFNLSQGSSFRSQLDEIIEVTSNLTEEEQLIANFWDCNPFMVDVTGHMAIGIKKISPGGHWMGITGIAAEMEDLSFAETAYIHTLVGMTLHDAFISCWKAKYETDRIRPETVINEELDRTWRPLLQTPPFPEYTSGHSVISRASAIILTNYFGDNFDFLDTSEIYFGLPEREFQSFLQASEEAAISRLYGGIHFRDAIEEGVKQGEKIGEYIWANLEK